MKQFLVLWLLVLSSLALRAAAPIRLHPENPRWFEWRGKAKALITSAEHYGAVLNPDFDFRRYLEAMQRAPGVVVRVLSHPGKAHALYLEGRGPTTLTLSLARGRWTADWVSVVDGQVMKRENVSAKGKFVEITSPEFADGLALRITR